MHRPNNITKDNFMPTEHKIVLGNSQHMPEIPDESIQLMITSPPYPMIKMWDSLFEKEDPEIAMLWKSLRDNPQEQTVTDLYETMHKNLEKTWQETFRVLVDGGIACINIGDATRTINRRFRLFPNHSQIIERCMKIGFTPLPYILWKKPTTKPTYKGKGAFLGSGFLPPNAYVTLDCEFILIFRKGNLRFFPKHDKLRYESAFTKKQRDDWFTQIWAIKGASQTHSQLERRTAAFPEGIIERLVNMFSVKGDTVLDPFVGSGTTTKVAMQAERNSIGYEIDSTLLPLLENRLNEEPGKYTLTITRR
jgi:site-specific DNA-methyltransferase (cytosine-N4-specific)